MLMDIFLPNFQNKYGQGQAGIFKYVDGLGGGTSDNITYSWGPKLDAGIASVMDTYGKSNRNKYRAMFYYLLVKHFRKASLYK